MKKNNGHPQKFKQIDPKQPESLGFLGSDPPEVHETGLSSSDESRHSVVFPVPLRPKKTVTSPSLGISFMNTVVAFGTGWRSGVIVVELYMHVVM